MLLADDAGELRLSTDASGNCFEEEVVEEEGEFAYFEVDFLGCNPACLDAIVEFNLKTSFYNQINPLSFAATLINGL